MDRNRAVAALPNPETPVEELGLSRRALAILRSEGVSNVQDVVDLGSAYFRCYVEGCGPSLAGEIGRAIGGWPEQRGRCGMLGRFTDADLIADLWRRRVLMRSPDGSGRVPDAYLPERIEQRAAERTIKRHPRTPLVQTLRRAGWTLVGGEQDDVEDKG